MDGQITIDEYLKSLKKPKCTECEFEKIDTYCGLGMCRHPLVMTVHRRWRGKFSARYAPDPEEKKNGYPDWCPIMDPKRWEVYKC